MHRYFMVLVLLLGFGLAAPFLLDLALDKLDPLGPAGPAGPQEGAVAQLVDNLGQGALQIFSRNHGDFQFQPVFRAFFSSRHATFLGYRIDARRGLRVRGQRSSGDVS